MEPSQFKRESEQQPTPLRRSERKANPPVKFAIDHLKDKKSARTPIKAKITSNGEGAFKIESSTPSIKSPKKRTISETNKKNTAIDVSRINLDELDESDDQANSSGENFQPTTDYFQQFSVTVKKSANTLKKIDLSVLSTGSRCTAKDAAARGAVIGHHEKLLFPKVYGLLIEKFSVILYGVGSKRNLLEKFKEQWLIDERFLKICGYFLELNLKAVLMKLSKLFDIADTSNESDFFERAAALRDDLFLVIHSMDILFTTDPKIKRFLVKLNVKCAGKLHIVGTVDHINSALMFDLREAQKLNLVHLEATTYESYDLEVGFIKSGKKNKKGMLGLGEQALTLNGIMSVYNSVPENSKRVLLLIFRNWLEYRELNRNIGQKDESDGKGLEFKRVAQKAREDFLTTSDGAFKSRLSELKDHRLIKVFKSDGNDYITVLIDDFLVEKFVAEIESE